MADWSKLHDDFLVEIARRIRVYSDFICFGGVCCSWRAAAIMENFRYAHAQLPWLMLPGKTCKNDNYDFRSFLNVSTGKIRQVFLPEVSAKRYFSSNGWLITIAENLSMSLLHPFSSLQIKLPHLKKFESFDDLSTPNDMVNFITKCVLSANPFSESNYILMVIHGDLRKLGYYKAGDKSWTTIEEWQCAYMDVAYYNGQFYAIDCDGRIVACDFRGGDPVMVTVVARISEHILKYYPFYIVESDGSLLVIVRINEGKYGNSRSEVTYQTMGFGVYKVEFNTQTCNEVKDLGDKAIFLGYNFSFSLKASDSIESKPNSIYFTDDNYLYYHRTRKGGGKDMGIYYVKEEILMYNFGAICVIE